MFRIQLNALWSRDYVAPLAKVLSENLSCDLEEAQTKVKELGEGKMLLLRSLTVGKANALACELLEYGCYIAIEQVSAISDELLIEDLENWFCEDQQNVSVLFDNAGHVDRIVEEVGFGFLVLETQVARDWVGEELVRLGARRLEMEDLPALQLRLKLATAANEARRMDIRANRAITKRKYLAEYDGPEALSEGKSHFEEE